MLEQESRGTLEQRAGIDAVLRQRAQETERFAHRGRGFVVGHGPARDRVEPLRDLIHQPMPERAERRAIHRQRRFARPSGVRGIPGGRHELVRVPRFHDALLQLDRPARGNVTTPLPDAGLVNRPAGS